MSKQPHWYWHDFIECAEYDIPERKVRKLETFLRSKSRPGVFSSLAMADGFLTALAIGPSMIARHPYQGLELIWGDTSMTCMTVKRHSKENKMTNILYERLANIDYLLAHERRNYRPLIRDLLGDPDTSTNEISTFAEAPQVVSWCRGFMNYFCVAPEAWQPIFETETGRSLIWPFICFGTDSGLHMVKQNGNKFISIIDQFDRHLSHYVFGVKDYFQVPHYVEDVTEFLTEIAPLWPAPTSAAQVRRL